MRVLSTLAIRAGLLVVTLPKCAKWLIGDSFLFRSEMCESRSPGGGRSASVMDASRVGVKPTHPTPPPRIRAATTLPLQSTSEVSDVDQLIMPNPGTPGFGGRAGVLRCACVKHFRTSP